MSLTISEARDSITRHIRDRWMADGVPSHDVPLLFWDDGQEGPSSGAWARLRIQFSSGGFYAFGGETSLFNSRGVVMIQIFTPLGDGQSLSDDLAQVALSTLRVGETREGVFFNRERVEEQDAGVVQPKCFHTIVFSGFEFFTDGPR